MLISLSTNSSPLAVLSPRNVAIFWAMRIWWSNNSWACWMVFNLIYVHIALTDLDAGDIHIDPHILALPRQPVQKLMNVRTIVAQDRLILVRSPAGQCLKPSRVKQIGNLSAHDAVGTQKVFPKSRVHPDDG